MESTIIGSKSPLCETGIKHLENIKQQNKCLESCNKVFKKQNEKLIQENKILQERINVMESRMEKLPKNYSKNSEESLKEEKNRETTNTEFSSESSKNVKAIGKYCEICEIDLDSVNKEEQITIVTKAELDRLENDVQFLKNEFCDIEKSWDGAIEQEKNNRHLIFRFCTENHSNSQIIEYLKNELRSLREESKEKEKELRSLRNALSSSKK